MSKFKNKKALALSVGAIMAGVSVIGVAAACAPTKAKPSKSSQSTQNPSQSGGSQSTNPGSGSTTNPSGQGSENNTTNPSAGSTNTNPGSQVKPEDKKMQDDNPNVDKGEQSGKSETPGANGKDDKGSADQETKPVVSVTDNAKLAKNDSKYSLTLSVTNANNKYLEVELTEVVSNQQEATKVKTKAKVESNNVTVSFDNLKPGTKYKVSALKLYDNETTSDGTSVDLSTTLGAKEFSTEPAQAPKVNAAAPTPQNPVSITLEDNAMLVKKDSKYELSLNVANANDKYLEIELTKIATNSENQEDTKISNKAKVQGGKVTVSFDKLDDGAKYKITDAQLYDNEQMESGATVKLSDALIKREITIKTSDSSDQGNKDQMSGSGKADGAEAGGNKNMGDSTLPPNESEMKTDPEVKPITVSLDEKQKLSEKNGDFVLEFSFANANEKYLEVELKEDKESEPSVVVKSKAKVKVIDNKGTFVFSNIELYSKYKIKSIKAYDKLDGDNGSDVEFNSLKDREILVDTKVLTPVAFQRDPGGLPLITLEASTTIYKKYIENKTFGFLIENKLKILKGSTHFVYDPSDLKTPIRTREISSANGKTKFYIYTDHEYKNEKDNGNWYISSLWESKYDEKSNLLTKNIDFNK